MVQDIKRNRKKTIIFLMIIGMSAVIVKKRKMYIKKVLLSKRILVISYGVNSTPSNSVGKFPIKPALPILSCAYSSAGRPGHFGQITPVSKLSSFTETDQQHNPISQRQVGEIRNLASTSSNLNPGTITNCDHINRCKNNLNIILGNRNYNNRTHPSFYTYTDDYK